MGQVKSINAADYQDVPRPVAALVREYDAGYTGERHAHQRAQLLHAIAGTMLVTAEHGSWIIPPHRALWIPPTVSHEVHCRDKVSLRTVYIEPACCHDMGTTCRALDVSNLLSELLVEAGTIELEYDLAGRDGRLMQLLLDEIRRMETLPLYVPMPGSRSLAGICRRIVLDPSLDLGLDDCAALTAMARRTFTRRFREETGMTFAQWRQQVRLREAVVRLGEGDPVTTVALAVGYETPSAFTAVFRRALNILPSKIPALSSMPRRVSGARISEVRRGSSAAKSPSRRAPGY
jgi:AraC-like DNA-binding protein